MMINIALPDEVAKELNQLAQTQQKSVAEVVMDLLKQYKSQGSGALADDRFESIIGIFDDPVTDLSSTTREALAKIVQDKYGRSD
jgi:metal-responsive CopG/Arc/MetJ family transcriptional regulator